MLWRLHNSTFQEWKECWSKHDHFPSVHLSNFGWKYEHRIARITTYRFSTPGNMIPGVSRKICTLTEHHYCRVVGVQWHWSYTFTRIISNFSHTLQQFLQECLATYSVRSRTHSKVLISKRADLYNYDFIIRLLYKNHVLSSYLEFYILYLKYYFIFSFLCIFLFPHLMYTCMSCNTPSS